MDLLLGSQRQSIVDQCRQMAADGLIVGSSGNISVRHDDLIAATPSGVAYHDLQPDMVGVHRLDGSVVEARLPATTELPMHLAVYRVTGARAVVHTHSPAATAVSTLVDELPSIHYLVALFGGPVRVARYATYGTDELAGNAAAAMTGRNGCLLANHGAITSGDSLSQTYDRARYLEWLCDVWLRARSAGVPRLLPSEELERVASRLESYGRFTTSDATPETPSRSP